MKTFVHEIPEQTAEKHCGGKLRIASASEPLRPNGMVRIVLAEDHHRVRRGLRTLLEHTSDLLVIGEARDGIEAIHLVKELLPDVLLLDIEMPRMNGNQVAAYLQERAVPVRILALSAHDDREYILGMLGSGVSGYLTKEEAPDVLVSAIRGIARGEQGWVSKRVAEKLAQRGDLGGLDPPE